MQKIDKFNVVCIRRRKMDQLITARARGDGRKLVEWEEILKLSKAFFIDDFRGGKKK
jgi:hypothetical protein